MKTMRMRIGIGVLAAVLLLAGSPGEAAPQDVTVKYLNRVEFGGTLGRTLRLLPGFRQAARGEEEVIRVQGNRLRSDFGDGSTIVDAGARRMITVDHSARQYTILTPESMAEAIREAQRQAEAAVEEARREAPEAAAEPQGDVKVTARVESRVTGRRAPVAGVDAEQVHVTVYLDFEGTNEDSEVVQGSLVVFSDVWTSRDGPAPEIDAVWQAWGEAMMGNRELRQAAAGLEQAFAMDPRIQLALEQNREALEKLEGTAVRTTTFLVVVPHGVTFSPEAALADAERDLSQDLGAAAGAAARAAAADAARGAIGGITRGVLGRGRQQEAPPPAAADPDPTQATLIRIVQELTEVSRRPVPGDIFEPPTGYRELDWRAYMRQGG